MKESFSHVLLPFTIPSSLIVHNISSTLILKWYHTLSFSFFLSFFHSPCLSLCLTLSSLSSFIYFISNYYYYYLYTYCSHPSLTAFSLALYIYAFYAGLCYKPFPSLPLSLFSLHIFSVDFNVPTDKQGNITNNLRFHRKMKMCCGRRSHPIYCTPTNT